MGLFGSFRKKISASFGMILLVFCSFHSMLSSPNEGHPVFDQGISVIKQSAHRSHHLASVMVHSAKRVRHRASVHPSPALLQNLPVFQNSLNNRAFSSLSILYMSEDQSDVFRPPARFSFSS
jgi:hypothetical protein